MDDRTRSTLLSLEETAPDSALARPFLGDRKHSSLGMGRSRILIVDDSPVNAEFLARSLYPLGYAVSSALSGREALDLIGRDAPDVVLLDVIMPDLSGKEVLRRLRSSPATADLPVILVSGLGETGDIVEGLELGANDYVTKPINLPVLQARLATQSALKRARDDLKRTAKLLADQIEHNAGELQVAGQVQRSILPKSPPPSPGLATSWWFEPYGPVSGDLFDVVRLSGGRLLLFVADAMGHGIQAALVVSAVKATLAAHLNEADDLPILMGLLDLAVGDLFDDRFVTAAACVIDPRVGRLRYALAGHPPILVAGPREVISLEAGGLPLGTHLGLSFQGGEIALPPQSRILLYSDGLTEALDPEDRPFGSQALLDLFRDAPDGPDPEATIRAIREAIDAFRGPVPFNDDLTVLAAHLL